MEAGGKHSLYVDPENIEDILSVLKRVLSDSELREEIIKNGLKHAQNFKEEKVVNEIGAKLIFTEDIIFSSTNLINRYLSNLPEEINEYLRLGVQDQQVPVHLGTSVYPDLISQTGIGLVHPDLDGRIALLQQLAACIRCNRSCSGNHQC